MIQSRSVLGALVLLCLSACSAPIKVERTSVRNAHHQFAANALEGQMSDAAAIVLHRHGARRLFDRDPEAALKLLHERAGTDDRRDTLYALAALNHLHASRLARSLRPGVAVRAPDFYLASAIYAWFFLLEDGPEPPPDAFDRRFRNACDLYNYGVALGFAAGSGTNAVVRPGGGSRELGVGRVEVEFSQADFKWDLADIERFIPADELRVRGLSVRDRVAGLGAPLVGVGRVLDAKRFARRIPATLVLRVPGTLRDWGSGTLRASLELYSSFDVRSIEVAGRQIPLEADYTAPMAHGLNEGHVWRLGLQQFLSGEERIRSNIYLAQPYEPGRIPVIFVHGTGSSPVWWAEMWNTLRTDPVLKERVQFWNFIYNSGNPVPHSAAKLRAEIERKISQLDPEGKDPALRRMVVVGHSQGGLLAELTVKDSGDALWRAVSKKDFDKLDLPADEREEVRKRFFFTPVSGVKRVVFISTPHRGSYLATSLVRGIALRLVKLPTDVVRSSARILTLQNPLGLRPGYERRTPTSLDDMAPGNPWLKALAEIPPAPGVVAHSIVALKGGRSRRTAGMVS